MTHNTREIEEVVKEFYKIFDTDNLWQGEDEWTKNVPIGNIEQWLRTTLHHQLQKARQDWKMASVEPVAKAIYNQMSYTEDGVKPEWVERGNSFKQDEARQLALKALDHSELDQDTELLNSVKEDWDKQAKNAMNGLDQDVSK